MVSADRNAPTSSLPAYVLCSCPIVLRLKHCIDGPLVSDFSVGVSLTGSRYGAQAGLEFFSCGQLSPGITDVLGFIRRLLLSSFFILTHISLSGCSGLYPGSCMLGSC